MLNDTIHEAGCLIVIVEKEEQAEGGSEATCDLFICKFYCLASLASPLIDLVPFLGAAEQIF